ncbi:hypothetical protein [Granulicella tundricola]|uniref:hypothetical protein n=1 Tax=Granulicella tundricola TaxID=940615 RepID=UPI0012F8BE71|nr:hypothetical protein [Granulicella tundricola]
MSSPHNPGILPKPNKTKDKIVKNSWGIYPAQLDKIDGEQEKKIAYGEALQGVIAVSYFF